jgi:hypothetical protein
MCSTAISNKRLLWGLAFAPSTDLLSDPHPLCQQFHGTIHIPRAQTQEIWSLTLMIAKAQNGQWLILPMESRLQVGCLIARFAFGTRPPASSKPNHSSTTALFVSLVARLSSHFWTMQWPDLLPWIPTTCTFGSHFLAGHLPMQ